MKTVEEICSICYPGSKHLCNLFLRNVTAALGIPLSGTSADEQIRYMSISWTKVARPIAIRDAKTWFVCAGLRANDSKKVPKPDHGHVAIVVPGALYHGIYPRVWCGNLGDASYRSQGDLSVGEVWAKIDRDNVEYFELPLMPLNISHSFS